MNAVLVGILPVLFKALVKSFCFYQRFLSYLGIFKSYTGIFDIAVMVISYITPENSYMLSENDV
jgi:hypothetical protein